MKSFILPIILALLGTGGGVGVALFLKTGTQPTINADACAPTEQPAEIEQVQIPIPLEEREYARMNNQFVVPVVSDDRMQSLMVLSLSIEVQTGGQDAVFAHEPRLRDAFLQVMFDHANRGGFNGAFTASSNMRVLRNALQSAADDIMPGHISDVLVIEMVRQDVGN